MASLLDQILAGLAPDGTGHFCFECITPDVRIEVGSSVERFVCANGHSSQRSYLFDGRAIYSIEDGQLVHEIVAALIRRDNRTLLFRRTRFPIGFTVPAAHVETGSPVFEQLERSVHELVGLKVTDAREAWSDEAPVLVDRCCRGADRHRWHLFEAEATGEVQLPVEHGEHLWCTNAEILDFASNRLLIPPVREVFHRLDVI